MTVTLSHYMKYYDTVWQPQNNRPDVSSKVLAGFYASIEVPCAIRAAACSESPSTHVLVFPIYASLVHDLVQIISMSSLVPSASLNIWMSVSSPPFLSN